MNTNDSYSMNNSNILIVVANFFYLQDQQVEKINDILKQVDEQVLEKAFYRFERPPIQ